MSDNDDVPITYYLNSDNFYFMNLEGIYSIQGTSWDLAAKEDGTTVWCYADDYFKVVSMSDSVHPDPTIGRIIYDMTTNTWRLDDPDQQKKEEIEIKSEEDKERLWKAVMDYGRSS